jgi:hypothetical protein
VSFARILLFALVLTHVVGIADLVIGDACEAACDDDGCGNDCLPGLACRCHCPSAMPLLGGSTQTTAKLAMPRDLAPPADDQRMHASPDPREILHVPRHAG